MSNLVIVAIPEQDDPVWNISSEKVPHITLLFLGDVNSISEASKIKIVDFLDHASNISLCKFSLEVSDRGILGPDQADVVYFEGWDLPNLKQFRGQLLQESNIQKAYLSATQFPEWQPHLTLGYPDTPAKKFKDQADRVRWIYFDRIALWTGDFDGPEFKLKNNDWGDSVAMSTVNTVDEILAHHGIKGMKWGVRRASITGVVNKSRATAITKAAAKKAPQDVQVNTKIRRGQERIKTTGGKNQPAHQNAIEAKVSAHKAKKSGLHSLSNEELKVLATRLNLEKQVSELAKDQLTTNGEKAIKALLEAHQVLT